MNQPSLATPSCWLRAARILILIWVLVSIVSLVLYLPLKYQSLRNLEISTISGTEFEGWSTEQLQSAVRDLGIRPEAMAVVRLTASLICLLCFWGIAGLLLWRKSDTWIGLLAAYILFATGPGFSGLLLNQSPTGPWAHTLYSLSATLTWPTFFVSLYLFPSGQIVPRFTRYLAVLPYLLFAGVFVLPDNRMLNSIGPLVLIGYALGGLVSQIYRYRKVSTPDERQQTKWVVFVLGIFLCALVLLPIIVSLFPALAVETAARFWFDFLGNGVIGILLPALIPLSIGISILRYRLWDIDVIIRKTLVYALLTGLLALVYFGTVILLQTLVGQATGEQPSLVIVVSTLLIAALFTALRRRIQALIDRRFYRKKYNAQQILAQFAQTARDEVEMEVLTAELRRVVQETIQPEQISLWLKPPAQLEENRHAYTGI